MSDLAAQLAHYRVTHIPTSVGPVVAWLPPLDDESLPPPTQRGIRRLLADLAAVDEDELDEFESDLPDADVHSLDARRAD